MDDNGDDEDYGFDYSDEEDADEENDVSLENEYYNAKGLLEDGARVDAAAGFLRVLQLERDLTGAGKGEWGFKALKQLIYLHVQERQLERALEYYQQLLTYVRSAVTRNYSERVIGELLDWLGASEHVPPGLLSQFYERTLATLVDEGTQRSERLWFKTEVRRGYLMLERGEYAGLSRLLKELHRFCRQAMRPTASKEAATAVPEETVVALDTDADVKIGSQLLELYALEMQLQMALTPGWTAATVSSQRARPGADSAGDAAVGGDYRGDVGAATAADPKLKSLYQRALRVRCAIPHPRIMGIIRECGGKVHMAEGRFRDACTDLFEAFKNYDEAGAPRRLHCLKYLVLANMLANSEINPFDSQEALPYRNEPEVVAIIQLVAAYQSQDLHAFEAVLKQDRHILADEFMRPYVRALLNQVREGYLLKLMRPYRRVRIAYLAQCMGAHGTAAEEEVEELLVSLILDGRIRGIIDQCAGVLELHRTGSSAASTPMRRNAAEENDALAQMAEMMATELRPARVASDSGVVHSMLQGRGGRAGNAGAAGVGATDPSHRLEHALVRWTHQLAGLRAACTAFYT
ncbi:hypothetical protein CDCA_CDCA09G2665 [Cyanidium caldarium]|uniref:PCI domain-containing protein n=1 Tax=Cyanidium caldarium TaxID=2771 RepID=A0AAV9IX21_CYACA|nr:hypothetical protein CDCA_CDCA09G2665 [Cyanidium caldarium]